MTGGIDIATTGMAPATAAIRENRQPWHGAHRGVIQCHRVTSQPWRDRLEICCCAPPEQTNQQQPAS
jgi:hypothetical protein